MEPIRLKDQSQMTDEQRRIHTRNMQQAHSDYNARQPYFQRRRRARNFLRGHQFSDRIYDNKYGDMPTEETYLQRRGRLTTKNNQIDPIIRNLIGQFRESYPSSMAYGRNRDNAMIGDMMTEALRYVEDLNETTEIDVQQFREALMSGAWGNRVEYDWFDKLNDSEVSFDPIEQPRLAYNSDLKDIRLRDLTRWVYLHDLSIDEIISVYAESKRDVDKILQWYGKTRHDLHIDYNEMTGEDISDAIDFHYTHDSAKHRVVEIWRKEFQWENIIHDRLDGRSERTDMTEKEVAVINAERIDQLVAVQVEMMRMEGRKPTEAEVEEMRQSVVDSEAVALIDFEQQFIGVWHCYHYTPWGQLLYQSETPYDHNESPLELYLHPLTDGEVYGLIETIIDQQKYFNRSISMLDFLLATSAKGVLMIDKKMVPKEYLTTDGDGNTNLDRFTDKWAEFDGVIYYESDSSNPTRMPQHVVNNAMPAGLTDMLKIQHDLMKEISGVLGPVAGHNPSSGTPASLYMQQTINASMTNRDIFESFFAWMRRRNKKALQLIQQFWTELRYIKTGGSRSARASSIQFDPHLIAGIDFDIVVNEGVQSALYRQVIEESLKEYLANQLITFEEYLEESTMPYADTLLETIRHRKAQPPEDQAAGMQQPQPAGTEGAPPPGMPQQN